MFWFLVLRSSASSNIFVHTFSIRIYLFLFNGEWNPGSYNTCMISFNRWCQTTFPSSCSSFYSYQACTVASYCSTSLPVFGINFLFSLFFFCHSVWLYPTIALRFEFPFPGYLIRQFYIWFLSICIFCLAKKFAFFPLQVSWFLEIIFWI